MSIFLKYVGFLFCVLNLIVVIDLLRFQIAFVVKDIILLAFYHVLITQFSFNIVLFFSKFYET